MKSWKMIFHFKAQKMNKEILVPDDYVCSGWVTARDKDGVVLQVWKKWESVEQIKERMRLKNLESKQIENE